jgi:hypothetical protein
MWYGSRFLNNSRREYSSTHTQKTRDKLPEDTSSSHLRRPREHHKGIVLPFLLQKNFQKVGKNHSFPENYFARNLHSTVRRKPEVALNPSGTGFAGCRSSGRFVAQTNPLTTSSLPVLGPSHTIKPSA